MVAGPTDRVVAFIVEREDVLVECVFPDLGAGVGDCIVEQVVGVNKLYFASSIEIFAHDVGKEHRGTVFESEDAQEVGEQAKHFGKHFLELVDFGVSALVYREYCEFGAIGVGRHVLDGDVPFVLEELCAEVVSKLEVGAPGGGANGIVGVNEVEVQDVVVSFGTAFPVFIVDLIERGAFATRSSCGGDRGVPVWVCHSCSSRL